MIIKDVTIKTEYRYEKDEEESQYSSEREINFLQLEIPLPGGSAIYKIDISEDIKKSLEDAQALFTSKERHR